MKLFIAIILMAAIVSGCAIAAKFNALEDMERSRAAYKRCLEQNPANPEKCAGLKQAYEADLRAYRETSKALRTGGAIISVEGD